LVSRHGIRTPFPAANLGQPSYSSFSKDGRPWPDDYAAWGAAGSEHLTAHGGLVLQRMGEYMKQILPFTVESNTSTFYSDNDSSNRDLETAQHFLGGLGVVAPSIYHEINCTQWLFNQGMKEPASGCALPSEAMLEGQIGGSIAAYSAQYADDIEALNDAIGCCNASVCGAEDCDLMKVKTSYNPVAFWSLFTSPLSVSSALTEALALMYQNGMDVDKVAPGLGKYSLSRLLDLHAINLRITDASLITAQAFGSQLLDHLLQTITQLTSENDVIAPSALLSAASDNFVYYAAHDINIYFLASLLRLQWQTASYQMNMSPPGSMLGFQLLQDEAAEWYIKLHFFSQSMDQQRYAAPLNQTAPPSCAEVIIPDCYGGPELSCAVKDFQKLVSQSVRQECVRPDLECS